MGKQKSKAPPSRKKVTPVEEEGELSSDSRTRDEQYFFVSPFLLGVAVALLLVTIPTVAGFWSMCGDLNLSMEEPLCPVLRVKKAQSSQKNQQAKKKKNWLHKWRRRQDEDQDVAADEYSILLQDPRHVACRSIVRVWSLWRSKYNNENAKLLACSPKVVDGDSMEGGDGFSNDGIKKFQTAYTNEFLEVTAEEKGLIVELGSRTKTYVKDWESRVALISWGGPQDGVAWCATANPAGTSELERLDGGSLFYSYLRIMKWPTTLMSTFPFKLCAKGCKSEVALEHTLTFRENFMPWAVSPSTIKENSNGVIFHHGFSPGFDQTSGGHSLVWIRPARRVKVGDIYSTRVYVNALEQAIAASLKNSNGRLGKFNVVLDGHNFSWGLMPSLHQLKVFVTMLQDHFPDRLGIIMLTNLGRVGEFVVGIVKPIISEEVRQKIVVLPRDESTRQEMLKAVVGSKHIPKWLGGVDSFEFDANAYYAESTMISDEDATRYTSVLPYHT